MIEKCNKIYSIFNEGVVFSKNNNKINAIQGYDILDISNVGGIADIIKWFRTSDKDIRNINLDTLYRFTNPATGDEWYIGYYLIAYNLAIKALFNFPVVLLDSFDTLFEYKYFFSDFTDVKKGYKIGYLSTPERATINYVGKDSLETIKLPYII